MNVSHRESIVNFSLIFGTFAVIYVLKTSSMKFIMFIYLKTTSMKKDWKSIVLYIIRVIELILTGAAGGAASQMF